MDRTAVNRTVPDHDHQHRRPQQICFNRAVYQSCSAPMAARLLAPPAARRRKSQRVEIFRFRTGWTFQSTKKYAAQNVPVQWASWRLRTELWPQERQSRATQSPRARLFQKRKASCYIFFGGTSERWKHLPLMNIPPHSPRKSLMDECRARCHICRWDLWRVYTGTGINSINSINSSHWWRV